ncbi:phenylalanyl-tRNA synthetase beta subunit [Bacillus pakistanensis]|uniref:Phenylalanyl-tRNA synthetase beta subunit n=1 Tax=Rossellomorea pakistanensis TaxID=992288 RepID=A0ABS2NG58_9BACI|nr:RNA polymerase subunit sigma [Bacillus pakistanensis]MBM7586858.1 phenylalanyl-tRNA synthetase beta subunit [Bacillus pakistanensis]
MSLKAIELQIALPKTFEAGKIADQQQQQSQLAQNYAAEESVKELTKKRIRVSSNEAKQDVTTMKEPSQRNSVDKSIKQENSLHPYKGILIDYNG